MSSKIPNISYKVRIRTVQIYISSSIKEIFKIHVSCSESCSYIHFY